MVVRILHENVKTREVTVSAQDKKGKVRAHCDLADAKMHYKKIRTASQSVQEEAPVLLHFPWRKREEILRIKRGKL